MPVIPALRGRRQEDCWVNSITVKPNVSVSTVEIQPGMKTAQMKEQGRMKRHHTYFLDKLECTFHGFRKI